MARKEPKHEWSEKRNVYIPTIGSVWRLEEDWKFLLYDEHRNSKMLELFGIPRTGRWGAEPTCDVTLLAGCHLKISRIYIRQGCGDFDSVTFTLDYATPEMVLIDMLAGDKIATGVQGKMKKPRFWAKLQDVNTMIATVALDTLKIRKEDEDE